MTAPIRPASSKAFQREKWIFIPTIASATLAPTVAEATGGTTLDISCMLFDGTARPQKNTNLVDRVRRICDGAVYQQIGTTNYTGGEMLAAFDPQAAAASDGKKAWEKFPAGTTGYLWRRMGIAVATDVAAGQFGDTFPVEFDEPFPTTVGDGEAAENAFLSVFAITGPPGFNKAVLA
ncbi:MAG TPA: hypothetical protein VFK41_03080 [Nocardioidaceae bacterium]|nr:hypothetical protein [Nocardioidaceae bacterium]